MSRSRKTLQEESGLWVHPDLLIPDPHQPRTYFDPEYIEKLGESMCIGGQYEAIQVERIRDKKLCAKNPKAEYIIVGGENRWRAAKKKSIASVRIEVQSTSSHALDRHLKALGLNGVRQPLNKIDTARAFDVQLKRTDKKITAEELAAMCGVSVPQVYGYLALLALPEDIQKRIDPPTPKEERIPLSIAVHVARRVKPGRMRAVINQIMSLPTPAERSQAALNLKSDHRKERTRTIRDDVRVVQSILGLTSGRMARIAQMPSEVFVALGTLDSETRAHMRANLQRSLTMLNKLKDTL